VRGGVAARAEEGQESAHGGHLSTRAQRASRHRRLSTPTTAR
jgi:hypothetical protein